MPSSLAIKRRLWIVVSSVMIFPLSFVTNVPCARYKYKKTYFFPFGLADLFSEARARDNGDKTPLIGLLSPAKSPTGPLHGVCVPALHAS